VSRSGPRDERVDHGLELVLSLVGCLHFKSKFATADFEKVAILVLICYLTLAI
jgi:hypothetical protein